MSYLCHTGALSSCLTLRTGAYAVISLLTLPQKSAFSYHYLRIETTGAPGQATSHRRSKQMENLLIAALVRAGLCKEHAGLSSKRTGRQLRRYNVRPQGTRTRQLPFSVTTRGYHLEPSGFRQQVERPKEATRDEYYGLLDYYDEPSAHGIQASELPLSTTASPAAAKQERSGAVSASHELQLAQVERNPTDAPDPQKAPAAQRGLGEPDDVEDQRAIDRLKKTLTGPGCSHETLYDLYQALPKPRLSYLSLPEIRLLLRGLTVVERKTVPTMMRYLSVVDDLKEVGISLTVGEWNSKMAFIGRSMGQVTASEMESALHTFKDMELGHGLPANHVTFNVLFDLAAKAGKFGLAEEILGEIKLRGLDLDRYAHVGKIFYRGLMGDGDGIRAAYRQLVDEGHFVDTVVLNCVIGALLRAGEAPAAHHVYERMKGLHASRQEAPLPPRHWHDVRKLGKALQKAAKDTKGDSKRHLRIQKEAAFAPDLRTYRILVHHHSVETGKLDYVTGLLHDMQWYDLPLHGSIFLALLRGFGTHGGIGYSLWTISKLELVWTAFLRALDGRVDGIYLGMSITTWCLRAYAKCGNTDRMLEVWEQIKLRWKPKPSELYVVHKVIKNIMKR